MRTHARVVIIGAGIVGCSTAYFLTRMGWRDIVVLEQGPLGQNWGSTSHAPGMMFQHNVSKSVTQLAKWSADLYGTVRTPEPAFWRTGSMEIASTPERWEELKRRVGQAMSWGLDAELIGPQDVGRMIPILHTDDLYGAFFVPSDCVVNAAIIASGLAVEASAHGATFYGDMPVTGIDVKNGRVTAVRTPQGRIATEIVVSAAGIWGPLIGKMAGVPIPLTPMQHIFARTNPLPELADERDILRHPILRHQDKDLYFRQYGNAYGFGSYRHDPLPVDADDLLHNDHPAIMPYTPEQMVASLEDAYTRIPALRAAGLSSAFNGLFSFTPDGFSLLGESAAVRGFWSAEAVWITHAGGVGRAMAEWIIEGSPSIDLRESDLNRFHAHARNPGYIRTRANRQYIEVYDVIHPLDQTAEPRNLRLSPFRQRQEELGATFFESAGWERPQWYAANEAELARLGTSWPERNAWTARNWSPITGVEHRATRGRIALFDLTPFTKLEISGAGACTYLQWMAANEMDQPIGKVTYTAMLTARGGIRCDVTVTRLAADRFLLITGGASGMHDLAWLRSHLPDDGSVTIQDVTSSRCCIGFWGPQARNCIRSVSSDDFSNDGFPYFSARSVTVGHIPVHAARVSYVGELGWELYADAEYGRALWDTLWEAGQSLGIIAAGGGAFESLRLEKGYRLWGAEIHTEYTPYEAGLGFAVNFKKGDFLGREALQRQKAEGITRKLCCLTLNDPRVVVMGKEPILDGKRILGYVTSANYGYSVGKSIAYGYLPVAYTKPGTAVSIQFFGIRYAATVSREPLYDPENVRLKG